MWLILSNILIMVILIPSLQSFAAPPDKNPANSAHAIEAPLFFETRAEAYFIQLQKIKPPQKVEPYKRTYHFGGWAKNKKAGTCYNTRAKVLIRDNRGSLKFKDSNPCSVTEGEWYDLYAGGTFTDAQAIQIDHMVPLKEAYSSGAYKWNFKERCLYGNYLGYDHHLIAVDGEQNNEKSDQSPLYYMPSRKEYQCQYLKDWLTIKFLWGLSLTIDEQKHIIDLIALNSCNKIDFVVTKDEIQKQQKFFTENINLCAGLEKLMQQEANKPKK